MLNDSGPSVQLNNVNASQHVHVFGVHLSLDLSLDKHVSSVSTTCFNHLRQLRCIRRLLDNDAASVLIHRLQRVLNAAAWVVSETKKFDQWLSRLMHQECTLAGHYQASKLQTGHADPPVSARQGASVFIKLLHASRPRHQLTIPRHISALTVGGHLLSLVRRCSSLCQVIHKILLSAHQSSGNHWRHTSPLPISTFSALGVSHWMRYINTQYVLNCTIFCVVTGSLVPRFVNTCILE